jgi:hypothetical protein
LIARQLSDIARAAGECRMQSSPDTKYVKRQLGEKIAAIEGLCLSPELAAMFRTFDAENKSAAERLKAIHDHFASPDNAA